MSRARWLALGASVLSVGLACGDDGGAAASDLAGDADALVGAVDGQGDARPAQDSADAGPPFEPFAWQVGARDAATHRLCMEASAPDAAPDTTFITCAVEGERFAPDATTPPDSLVVMAYNLERGYQVDAQVAWLLTDASAPAPDIILVSEADRGCERTGQRHVTRDMAAALGMDYVFAVEFVELERDEGPPRSTVGTCEHGNAILSRWPLGNVRQLRHADQASWYYPPDGPAANHGEPRLGGRVAVLADVRVGDGLVRLASVHFESRGEPFVSGLQAAETADAGLGAGHAAVAGGDLNAPFYWQDLQTGASTDPVVGPFLERGYSDAHAGLPYEARITRPPGLVLDLVLGHGVALSQPGICPEARCGSLSDHLPVWATVALD